MTRTKQKTGEQTQPLASSVWYAVAAFALTIIGWSLLLGGRGALNSSPSNALLVAGFTAYIGVLLAPVLAMFGIVRSLITRLRRESVRGNVVGALLSLGFFFAWIPFASFLDL